jgi:hypothetical protein
LKIKPRFDAALRQPANSSCYINGDIRKRRAKFEDATLRQSSMS